MYIIDPNMIQAHINAIRDILLRIGEQVEGNLVCDIHPDNVQMQTNQTKIENLQNLVKGRTRVCEVGVNAGHSLLLMLEVNPTAEYVLFDIGIHRYTQPCVEYIQSQFPNTSIRITYGDSKETLPLCNEEFDFIHVDGGHNEPEVISDYTESMRLIRANCPIVFDDYDYPFIHTFLTNKLRTNKIQLFVDSTLHPTNQHILFTNPLKH
jgi:predicted O-methyltransferase YrrM